MYASFTESSYLPFVARFGRRPPEWIRVTLRCLFHLLLIAAPCTRVVRYNRAVLAYPFVKCLAALRHLAGAVNWQF